jgi:hypothetical protein
MAGCSDAPAAGTISFDRSGITGDGSATFTFTPPGNPFDALPPPVSDTLCVVNTVTDPANDAIEDGSGMRPLPECTDPHTEIAIHAMNLPEPSTEGYHAFLVGADGELDLGALAVDEQGMWTLDVANEQNLDGAYDATEIRMAGARVLTAGAASGGNQFAFHESMMSTSWEAAWEDMTLTASVTGLPTGVGLEGWLVSEDPDTGELVHDVSFPVVGDGSVTYTASETIDHWVEFHIHVAGSKVNVGIGSINTTP